MNDDERTSAAERWTAAIVCLTQNRQKHVKSIRCVTVSASRSLRLHHYISANLANPVCLPAGGCDARRRRRLSLAGIVCLHRGHVDAPRRHSDVSPSVLSIHPFIHPDTSNIPESSGACWWLRVSAGGPRRPRRPAPLAPRLPGAQRSRGCWDPPVEERPATTR